MDQTMLEAAAQKYWEEVQEGLDDDQRDDIEVYDLVIEAFKAGAEAAARSLQAGL